MQRAQMRVVIETEVEDSLGHKRQVLVLSCPDCARITVVEFLSTGGPAFELSAMPTPEDPSEVAHLPARVEKYYRSAQRAMRADLPSSAAVELRRTLEAAADEFDTAEEGAARRPQPLVRRIQRLIQDGHVTAVFGEVLHLVRSVGNLGAHASDEDVDSETAEKMLMFTTQLLRNLFEVPAEIALLRGEPDGIEDEEAS